jgi:glutaredoxin 3
MSAEPTSPQVTVYTTDFCPYCYRAKHVLNKRGIAYREIDVSRDPSMRAWLVKTTGRRTVPQIFIGDEPIGGSDELVALDRAGELVKRVFGEAEPSNDE